MLLYYLITAKTYCANNDVCYTTFKRRHKLYSAIEDKTQFTRYEKKTNKGKRALDDQQKLAVRDEFMSGVQSGSLPNTNKALMTIMVKYRNASHPQLTPVTQLGNSVIQNFKKQMNIHTVDLNQVQGKKRPAELSAVMKSFAERNGEKYNNSKSGKSKSNNDNTTSTTQGNDNTHTSTEATLSLIPNIPTVTLAANSVNAHDTQVPQHNTQ